MSKKLLSLAALVALCLSAGYFAIAGKAKAPGEPQEAVVAAKGSATWDKLPFNTSKTDPATQILYTAAQLQAATGGVDRYQINKLIFPVNCDYEGSADVKIYASTTTQTSLTTVVSHTNQTLVYERTNFYFAQGNPLNITFDLDKAIELKKSQGLIVTLCISNISGDLEIAGGYYAEVPNNQALRAYPFNLSNPGASNWSETVDNGIYRVPAMSMEFEEVEGGGDDSDVGNDPVKATVIEPYANSNKYTALNPFNLYQKSSASQTIYDASLLEDATNDADNYEITKLYYTVGYNQVWAGYTPTFKIYAGPTDRTDFADSTPIPVDQLELVFDDQIQFTTSNYGVGTQLEFALSSPIKMKKGQNLAIFAIANNCSGDAIQFKANNDLYTKSISLYSDNANFDYLTATTGWLNSKDDNKRLIAALDIEYVATAGEEPELDPTFPNPVGLTLSDPGLNVDQEYDSDMLSLDVYITGTTSDDNLTVTLDIPEGWDGYFTPGLEPSDTDFKRKAPIQIEGWDLKENFEQWTTIENSVVIPVDGNAYQCYFWPYIGDKVAYNCVTLHVNVEKEAAIPAPEFPESFNVTTDPTGLDVNQGVDQDVWTITVNGEATEDLVTVTLEVPEGWDGFIGVSDYDYINGDFNLLKRLAARALEADWAPVEDAINNGYKVSNTFTFQTGEEQYAQVFLYKGEMFDANNMICIEVKTTKKIDTPVDDNTVTKTITGTITTPTDFQNNSPFNFAVGPVDINHPSSADYSLYPQALLSDLECVPGEDYVNITKISYPYHYSGGTVENIPIQVYMKNTTSTYLNPYVSLQTDQVKVFDGTVNITPDANGDGTLEIVLDGDGFNYTPSTNLQINIFKNSDISGKGDIEFQNFTTSALSGSTVPVQIFRTQEGPGNPYSFANGGMCANTKCLPVINITYSKGGEAPQPEITFPESFNVSFDVDGVDVVSQGMVDEGDDAGCYIINVAGTIDAAEFRVTIDTPEDWDGFYSMNASNLFSRRKAPVMEPLDEIVSNWPVIQSNTLVFHADGNVTEGWYLLYKGEEICIEPMVIVRANVESSIPAPEFPESFNVTTDPTGLDVNQGLDQDVWTITVNGEATEDLVTVTLEVPEGWDGFVGASDYDWISGDINPLKRLSARALEVEWYPLDAAINMGYKVSNTFTFQTGEQQYAEAFLYKGDMFDGNNMVSIEVNITKKDVKPVVPTEMTKTITGEITKPVYDEFGDVANYKNSVAGPVSVTKQYFADFCIYTGEQLGLKALPGESTVKITKLAYKYYNYEGDDVTNIPVQVYMGNTTATTFDNRDKESYKSMTKVFDGTVNITPDANGSGTIEFELIGEGFNYDTTQNLDIRFFKNFKNDGVIEEDVVELEYRNFEADGLQQLIRCGQKDSYDQIGGYSLYTLPVVDVTYIGAGEDPDVPPVSGDEKTVTITGNDLTTDVLNEFDSDRSYCYGPVQVYQANSEFQTVYYADQVGLEGAAKITKLSYNVSCTKSYSNIPLKIYMANTDVDRLSGYDFAPWDLTLVYDGTVEIEAGENVLNIELTTPFEYDATQNLFVKFEEVDSPYTYSLGTDRPIFTFFTTDLKQSYAMSGSSSDGLKLAPVVTMTYEESTPVVPPTPGDEFTKLITGSDLTTDVLNEFDSDRSYCYGPVQVYQANSEFQTVYYADQVAIEGTEIAKISKLSYNYSCTTSYSNIPLKIYMANTDVDRLSGYDFAPWDLTLVYEGTVDIEAGENVLDLEIETPFEYDTTKNLFVKLEEVDSPYTYSLGTDRPIFTFFTTELKQSYAMSGSSSDGLKLAPVVELTYTKGEGGGGDDDVLPDGLTFDEKVITSDDVTDVAPGVAYPYDTKFGLLECYMPGYAMQSIYSAAQMGLDAYDYAYITELTFPYNNGNGLLLGFELDLYLAEVDYASYGAQLNPEDMKLVYSGEFDLPGGANNLNLKLDNFFKYDTSKNLVILAVKKDNVAYKMQPLGFQIIPTGDEVTSLFYISPAMAYTDGAEMDMTVNGNLAMTVKYGHADPLPEYDLAGMALTGETSPIVDETYTYKVSVKNNSNVAVEGFTVELYKKLLGYGNILLQTLTVEEPLAAGETGIYDLDVRFAEAGEVTLFGKVVAPEGIEETRDTNNETPELKVVVKNPVMLSVETITAPAKVSLGETSTIAIAVKNNGSSTVSDYALNLVNVNGDNITTLKAVSDVPAIAAGATETINVSYAFPLAGTYNVAAQLLENGESSLSATQAVTVSYEIWPSSRQLTAPVNQGDEGSMPYVINGHENNSASEVIYLPEWLGDITRNAQLQKIRLTLNTPAEPYYNFTWPEVRISLACVDRTTGFKGNGNDDLVAEELFTEVYRGPLVCTPGMEYVEFELQNNFIYEPGKSLVVNYSTTGENYSPLLFFKAEYIEEAMYMKYGSNEYAVDPDFSVYNADRLFSQSFVPIMDLTYALEALPDKVDLKATSIVAPEEVVAGKEARFSVNIENVGTVAVDDFTIEIVDITDPSNQHVIATKTVEDPYAGQTKGTEYVYAEFEKAGTYNVAARIILTGDEDPTNNLTPAVEVVVGEAAGVDIAADNITGPTKIDVKEAWDYVVTVKNEGTAMPESLKVLVTDAAGTEFGSIDLLGAQIPGLGESADVTISATFATTGQFDIFGKVIADGDEDESNDVTAKLTIDVYPDLGVVSLFADGTVAYDAASGILNVRDARAVTVADIAGRLVLNQPVNGEAEFALDLRNGIYVVSVIKLDGTTQSIKIHVK